MVFPWEPNKAQEMGYGWLKGFHMPLEACAYNRKKGIMLLLPRGIERYSVRPWRVWN